MDFEADPIHKFKTLIIKTFFPISTSFQFPYITQLKFDFESDGINKLKTLKIKTIFPISKSIQFPLITQIKHCQKLVFEAGPNNN